jgi:toxoflavin biosynthesis protein ToxC
MIHQGPIAGIAAAGDFIATAGYDNRLILWDALSKRAVARSHHDHLINHCAFNSDGTMIATASSDYSARVWEIPSLRLKATFIGHDDDVDMAVFSPDDTRVATCALDRKIRIFDLSGRCLKVLRGHTGNILSVAWTRDGERLISSSVDGTIREWNVATGTEIRRNDIRVRTDTLVIDADGRILAGDDQGRIAIIIDGQISFTQAHQAGVKNISFDEASSILVTLSYDRTIAIWKLSAGQEVREIARTEFPALVWARAAVSIGPHRVAVGTFGSSFGVFDWKTNIWDMRGIVAGSGLNAVAVVDGVQYAIGDAGTLLQDGEPITQLGSLCNFLLAAGNRLFSGGQLGQLFDARSGEILYRHRSPLNCGASFIRDGKVQIVIGTYTGEALVFILEDDGRLRLLTILKVYENAIKGLAAAEDQIFSVCASTAIAWHDISDFKLIRLIPNAHDLIANGCCIAGPRGFASVGRDRKLRIWTGDREEAYQTPHPNSVKCICASDDQKTLMTGAYTGTLAGFDMATRSWVSFSRPTASGISALAYDGHNRHFLASSYDGHVYTVA